MKKLILFVIFILFAYLPTIFSQTLLEENFNYTVNQAITSNGWTAYSAATNNPILISSGSLAYPNYPSSGVGNSANIIGTSTSSEDDKKTFSEQTAGSVYASFLVNFSSATTAEAGDYFFGFFTFDGETAKGRVFVKKSGINIAFGLSKGSTTAQFSSFSYSLNTTYLIVLKYSFNSNSSDDVVNLFINPNLSGVEPSPNLTNIDNATDLTNVGAIFLRQGGASYNLVIDGIRVATSWDQAPLPVELTTFTASIVNKNVELNWQTATEVNNYGFNVERKYQESSIKNQEWEKIAFVEGHGNSNSPKYYSFSDKSLNLSGKYLYRLKQIDIDGKFEYSDEVEVNFGTPEEFELTQNYPNPFNPTTKIQFNLPAESQVKLSVFNILGEQVSELLNKNLTAGFHSVEFNGSKLNSGIYFYKLEANNFMQIRKMMLVK